MTKYLYAINQLLGERGSDSDDVIEVINVLVNNGHYCSLIL